MTASTTDLDAALRPALIDLKTYRRLFGLSAPAVTRQHQSGRLATSTVAGKVWVKTGPLREALDLAPVA